MNPYDRLRSTLTREFRTQAQPCLRSLWADVMELEEAADEPAFLEAREQILHRILALGRAAAAAHIHPVPAHCEALTRHVAAVGCAPDTVRAEAFAALYREMTAITGVLYGIHVEAVTGSRAKKSTEEMELVGCGAN